MTESTPSGTGPNRPSLRGHLAIVRVDHWFKNVFILPGVAVALTVSEEPMGAGLLARFLLGLLSACLVASSNYVLNEILDARFDAHHPDKRLRPVPSGLVSIPLAYAQWIALMLVGLALAAWVSLSFGATMLALWIMGCIYNVPPLRTKDRAYLDVLSEAVNNPIRMLAGWYIVGPDAIAPASLLLSYWMIGCYFMAIKRFAEYRHLNDKDIASAYRRSFRVYSEDRLLTSIMFYASAAMLFFGIFVLRYRLELVLSFPLVALTMAVYLNLGLRPDSPTQRPESLYRDGSLMTCCALCALLMIVCLLIDMPWLAELVTPLMPTR